MVEPARPARRARSTVLPALVAVSVAVIGILACQSLASSSSMAASPTAVPTIGHSGAPGEAHGLVPGGPTVPRGERSRGLGEADGLVPSGTTVFDAEIPGVANLDSDLLDALREAATDAAEEGIDVVVDSGWRSRKYQEHLFRQAVSEYGSSAKAARWVARPGTSPHELGDAVDLGPAAATAWLSRHGAGYGLCQIYRNETWHFELRPAAVDSGCPPMYADPSRDPRMRR